LHFFTATNRKISVVKYGFDLLFPVAVAEVYQISAAHIATTNGKSSGQYFQLYKLGAVLWRP
jgi:hypothetical protein